MIVSLAAQRFLDFLGALACLLHLGPVMLAAVMAPTGMMGLKRDGQQELHNR